MFRLIVRKKPLKTLGKRRRSNMKERWKTDAEWFEEDTRKHPEKYESKDDEVKVTSEEMEKHLQDFINKTD